MQSEFRKMQTLERVQNSSDLKTCNQSLEKYIPKNHVIRVQNSSESRIM